MQSYYFYYSLGTELYIRKQNFFELCFHFLCVFFGGKYVLLFTADICFVAAKHFSATLNQKASLVFRRQKEPRQEAQLMLFFQMKFTYKPFFPYNVFTKQNEAHDLRVIFVIVVTLSIYVYDLCGRGETAHFFVKPCFRRAKSNYALPLACVPL